MQLAKKGDTMKIAELQINQGKVDIDAEVTATGDIREFEKFGKQGKVCNATIKDESGEIKLTLWNEQIDTVKVGAKIKIKNGYVSEFRGEKQLSTGKFGSLELLNDTATDHGEHILTQDEKEEAEALNAEQVEPAIEEEVTEDELEEADISIKPKVNTEDNETDIDEEKVD